MEDSITLSELVSLLVLNSVAVICIGMVAQFLLLRRLAWRAKRAVSTLAATVLMGMLAIAFSLALSFAFPALIHDLGSLDLDHTLRFIPAWLGIAPALAIVTALCSRLARRGGD